MLTLQRAPLPKGDSLSAGWLGQTQTTAFPSAATANNRQQEHSPWLWCPGSQLASPFFQAAVAAASLASRAWSLCNSAKPRNQEWH